jgi:hypothetical protein
MRVEQECVLPIRSHIINLNDKLKKNEMGWALSTYGQMENTYRNWEPICGNLGMLTL